MARRRIGILTGGGDVPGLVYNTDRYRPLYGDKRGLPVFLTRG